jgi:hypothetical protein
MEQCIKFRQIAFWTGLLLAVFAVALITWSAWFNPWNNPPVFSDAVLTQIHAVTDVDRLRGIALKLVEMHTALNTDVAAMVHAWAMALALFASFVALFLIWFSRAMPRDVHTQGSGRVEP